MIAGNSSVVLQTETGDRSYVDLERAYCLADNDTIPGDILEINSDTGLLGSPKREDTYMTLEILFEPRIKLGQAIHIVSRDNPRFDGVFKVGGFEHAGIISGAVGGKCKTKIQVYVGDANFLALRGQGIFV